MAGIGWLLVVPGGFFTVMNLIIAVRWPLHRIFVGDKRPLKFVSNVPPLGSVLLIVAAFLIRMRTMTWTVAVLAALEFGWFGFLIWGAIRESRRG